MGIAHIALCLVLGLLWAHPSRADAQTAEQLVEDLDSFRAALGTVYGTVTLGPSHASYRLMTVPDGIELTDQRGGTLSWRVDAEGLGDAQRLLALVLGSGAVSTLLERLDAPLEVESLGISVMSDGLSLANRVGALEGTWIMMELGTSRPWEYHVALNGSPWTVRVESYSEDASGWFPDRVRILRQGQTAMTAELEGLTPDPALLEDPSAWLPPSSAIRFPRLPL